MIAAIGAAATLWALGILGAAFAVPSLAVLVTAEYVTVFRLSAHPRVRRAVDAHKARHARRLALHRCYSQLSRHNRRHYLRLRRLQRKTEHNYRNLSRTSQQLLGTQAAAVDSVLASCLALLYRKQRYEEHLKTVRVPALRRTIKRLRHEQSASSDPVQAVNSHRIKILEERLARAHTSREQLAVINAQVDALSDLLMNIHEQSLTLGDSPDVSSQLDELITQSVHAETMIEEIESILGTMVDPLAEVPDASSSDTSSRRLLD